MQPFRRWDLATDDGFHYIFITECCQRGGGKALTEGYEKVSGARCVITVDAESCRETTDCIWYLFVTTATALVESNTWSNAYLNNAYKIFDAAFRE